MYSQSRKMRGANFNRRGGGKPEGKEGGILLACQRTRLYPEGKEGFLTPLSVDVGLFYILLS